MTASPTPSPDGQPDDFVPEAAFDAEEAADDRETDLGRLETELRQANDRVLRSQAELENYRKRVRREMDEDRRYAVMPMLRDLLPVVDNLERAIAAAGQSEGGEGLVDGVRMVVGQLQEMLEKHHCTQIEAQGQPFDPHRHEAISRMPSADQPENSVMHVTQVGYLLHDRVVRPSQVVVAGPAANPAAPAPPK